MKYLFLICFSVFILFGCGKDDDESVDPPIGTYAAKYMVDKHSGAYYTNFRAFSFEYKNSKVIERTGGLECILNSSCQNEPTVIYDIAYDNNTINITNRSGSLEFSVLKQEWFFTLKSPDQPKSLIHKAENRQMYDSLAYEYDHNGKLKQINVYLVYENESEKSAYKSTIKDFFFDSAGNLSRTETQELLHDGYVTGKLVETFEDYDTAKNPFKHLFMFDDTFYRSLSDNNFRKYRRQEVDMVTGEVYLTQSVDWALQYSEGNVPQFDKL